MQILGEKLKVESVNNEGLILLDPKKADLYITNLQYCNKYFIKILESLDKKELTKGL